MVRALSIAAALATLATLATLVPACGGAANPPAAPPGAAAPRDAGAAVDAAPLDQDLAKLVELSLAMYREVATAFTAAGPSCADATARLREIARRYRDVAAANAKVLHDGRGKQLRAALGPHDEQFDAAAAAVVQSPTMSACAKDAAFGKAFDELVAPPP
jgi:hypothetical protein